MPDVAAEKNSVIAAPVYCRSPVLLVSHLDDAMSLAQLQLCKDLFQAVITCKQQCEQLVPASFNDMLLEALQYLMLQAVQLQQIEQLHSVRACLESAVQLLSRASCLGRIEAFFVADELLAQYQWRLDATHVLISRLYDHNQDSASMGVAVSGHCRQRSDSTSTSSQLQLPEQQQHVVKTFRQQAGQVCPLLAASCPPPVLQQLCETVRLGLLLANGHSFLIGQDWQREVAGMLARAEQLKVLLAHRQAHHLSLLASMLQLLHRQEVQEFDMPHGGMSSPSSHFRPPEAAGLSSSSAAAAAAVRQSAEQGRSIPVPAAAAGLSLPQQQHTGQVVIGTTLEGIKEEDEDPEDDEDDVFYIPVGPLAALSPTRACSSNSTAAAACPRNLLFNASADGAAPSSSADFTDDDSLVRMPSSGCSSLLEYVHNSLGPAAAGSPQSAAGNDAASAALCSGGSMLQPCLSTIERQLMSIAGSAEIAAVLAAALGLEHEACSHSVSQCGTASEALAAAAAAAGASCAVGGRQSSSTGQARPGSVVARISSSISGSGRRSSLLGGLVRQSSSSNSNSGCGTAAGQQQQQQQRRRRHQRWRRQASNALVLQHAHLPQGCCRSIGALCYVCPHLTRLLLVDLGLDDQAVGDLVDALRVNSSIQQLDLSCNHIEDIGARVLAGLVRPHHGSSSQLRALCLQHNAIGDDGAVALASALASSSQLRRLWLQHNAIGEVGSSALCQAMQSNTSCIDLKLLAGNNGVPRQLGQMVQQLAKHNRGVRDRIKGLLRALRTSSGSEED